MAIVKDRSESESSKLRINWRDYLSEAEISSAQEEAAEQDKRKAAEQRGGRRNIMWAGHTVATALPKTSARR